MKLDLPLTVEQMQELTDEANPFSIPPLVDLVSRCQDALMAINSAAHRVKTERDRVEFVAYVKGLIKNMNMNVESG